MRKNFGAKPYLYPMPVLIIGTYDENTNPNAMNAVWGGISEENQISICLSPGHKTVKNILVSKAFTVSVATEKHVVACDYVGIASGNSEQNKIEKAGFTTIKSEFVNAPIINELSMTLECKFISYNDKSCTMIGEIINVSIDESILNSNNKVDVAKLAPITFDPINNTYIKLGDVVGNAFKDGLSLKK
ncbi:flavin reductase family protein [Fusobacterium sp. PH5-44]|uniref:flavin reductase family protein n=1 Tax=unclassified Fusobacterium TaxID=2648384 RepID=UPI003D1D87F5